MKTVEQEIIQAQWFDYERVGYDRRLMELLSDHRIGIGSERCERSWRIDNEGESIRLSKSEPRLT